MTRPWASVLAGAVVVLLTATRVSAQDVRVSGHVDTDHIAYFERPEARRRAGRSELLAQIDGRVSLGPRVRLFGSAELRADFADHARDRLYANELYAELVYGKFDLRAGRQVIFWGKTDRVNPTDHLSPRDFTDPLESEEERLGVFAVRPRVAWGSLQWESAIVPVFTGSIMPNPRSRWSPSALPRESDPSRTDPVMRLDDEIVPPRRPATTLANMQYATRMSGTVRGWDLSASYFDGWNDVPRFGAEVSPSSAGAGSLRITAEHLRKRVAGGDVATVVGPFTVRAEAAHVRPDPRQGPQYFQYVAGADRTFGDMMSRGGTFVLVQWIQSILPADFEPAPLDFDYLFEKATMARVQHNVTEAAQITVEGLYEWERRGYYLQPELSYRFGSRVRAEARVDLLGGRRSEFFGLFAGNKRVQFRMRYSF